MCLHYSVTQTVTIQRPPWSTKEKLQAGKRKDRSLLQRPGVIP